MKKATPVKPSDQTSSPTIVSKMADQLHQAYRELETKFESLNQKLEETNQQLKQSLAEKERASSFLKNILESLTSGVLVIDLAGKITMFNKAAEDITGYKASEIVEKPYSEIIGKNVDKELSALNTLKTQSAHINEERELTNKKGAKVPLGFSTAPLVDSEGALLGVVEIFFDLTKIRKLEDEISRVKTLAALGEMAATVAHEVRNPLGGITGFADLLNKEIAESDPRKQYVKKIIEGVENLNRTVKNLLTYARMIKLAPQEVNLTRFLDEVVKFYEMDLQREKKNIVILREYAEAGLKAKIDPEHFRQVILNLLQNATQSMPKGGKVKISAEYAKDQNIKQDKLFLKIADSGSGMPREVLDKMFTPFFTTKEGGTGLGMATIKKIVEAHQGEIRVNSEVGKGTEVEICLPLSF